MLTPLSLNDYYPLEIITLVWVVNAALLHILYRLNSLKAGHSLYFLHPQRSIELGHGYFICFVNEEIWNNSDLHPVSDHLGFWLQKQSPHLNWVRVRAFLINCSYHIPGN